MSPQELQLHYFKMHDYDGNSLLDGLELSTAITHVHKEVGGGFSWAPTLVTCAVLTPQQGFRTPSLSAGACPHVPLLPEWLSLVAPLQLEFEGLA